MDEESGERGLPRLWVYLAVGDQSIEARPIRLSKSGLSVFVKAPAAAPRFGERLSCELGVENEDLVEVEAEVRHESVSPRGAVIGLEIKDWSRLYARAPAGLAAILNRRAQERAPSEDDREVRVRWAGQETPVEGSICDLSPLGLSFVLWRDVAVPAEVEEVELSFALPLDGRELSFVARVRHRSLAGGRERYGVLFDGESTPDFEARQGAIDEYIQGEVLGAMTF